MRSSFPATNELESHPDDFRWFAPNTRPVERAILLTVAYADIFDYPLAPEELRRYLIGMPAGTSCIQEAFASKNGFGRFVAVKDGYITLSGREEIVATRKRRAAISSRIWPSAVRYGRVLSRLPFVRMVAVTGALAVDNVETADDIDYLILSEHGRLWLSRAWCILLVRLARLRGVSICPNYFLSTGAVQLLEKSLYSAHEITQMVVLSGAENYQELRAANDWVLDYLPNAAGPPKDLPSNENGRTAFQRVSEIPQRSRIGSIVESWEMNRKIRRFSALPPAESCFSSDQCKGHFDLHGRRIGSALHERLREIESQL